MHANDSHLDLIENMQVRGMLMWMPCAAVHMAPPNT